MKYSFFENQSKREQAKRNQATINQIGGELMFRNKNARKFTKVVAGVLMASLMATGCGSDKSASVESFNGNYAVDMKGNYDSAPMYSGSMAESEMYDMDMGALGLTTQQKFEVETENGTTDHTGTTDSSNSDKVVLSQEKMIYRANVSAETLNFDESYAKLKSLLDQYGCIIANENITNDGNSYLYSGYRNARNGYTTEREAFIEIRVPSDKYSTLLENVESLGNVTAKNSNATNITRAYYDTQAELKSYQEEYQQLEKLMATATEMSDILEITNQMTMVRATINRLTSSLQTMDLDVAYSYINLTLTEVVEYTLPEVKKPKVTFWDRFVSNFEDTYTGFFEFLEWLLFFIIRVIPYAVLFGGIYLVYRKTPLYRKNKERKEAKRQNKLEKKSEKKFEKKEHAEKAENNE